MSSPLPVHDSRFIPSSTVATTKGESTMTDNNPRYDHVDVSHDPSASRDIALASGSFMPSGVIQDVNDPYGDRIFTPGGNRRGNPSITLEEYLLLNHQFDSRRFASIPAKGSPSNDPGKTKRGRDASWSMRWVHCPCRIRIDASLDSDLQYYRCGAEQRYLSRASHIMRDSSSNDVPGIHMVGYSYPFSDLYWTDRNRWGRFTRDEVRIRKRKDHFLHCWHNIEFFDVPSSSRSDLYVSHPSWWQNYEVSSWLGVPTPTVVAYFGSVSLLDSPMRDRFWKMVASEWTVFVFVAFVAAAQEGVHHTIGERYRGTEDLMHRRGLSRGRLFFLPFTVLDSFEQFGIDHLAKGSTVSVKTVRGLLAHVREYRWKTDQEWVPYDWESDTVGVSVRYVDYPPSSSVDLHADRYQLDYRRRGDAPSSSPGAGLVSLSGSAPLSLSAGDMSLLELQSVCRKNSEPVPTTVEEVLKLAQGWAVSARMHTWMVHNFRAYKESMVCQADSLSARLSTHASDIRKGGDDTLLVHDGMIRQSGVGADQFPPGALGYPTRVAASDGVDSLLPVSAAAFDPYGDYASGTPSVSGIRRSRASNPFGVSTAASRVDERDPYSRVDVDDPYSRPAKRSRS